MRYQDIVRWIVAARRRPLWTVAVVLIGLIVIALIGAADEVGRRLIVGDERSASTSDADQNRDHWHDQSVEAWLEQQRTEGGDAQ